MLSSLFRGLTPVVHSANLIPSLAETPSEILKMVVISRMTNTYVSYVRVFVRFLLRFKCKFTQFCKSIDLRSINANK